MTNLKARLKKAEKALNVAEKPITVEIVHFGGVLPPDHTEGNVTIRHVRYDDIRRRIEQQ